MDSFNFVKVQSSSKVRKGMPQIIRINGTHITMSPDVADLYGIPRGKGAPGKKLVIEYDASNFAVRLSEPDNEYDAAFSFRGYNVRGTDKVAVQTTTPRMMKDARMPKGIYRQLPEQPTVFVHESKLEELGLVRPDIETSDQVIGEIDLSREPGDIRIGDRVQWTVKKTSRNPRFVAFGTVAELVEKQAGGSGAGGAKVPAATIVIESKEYRKYFPYSVKTVVPVKDLTVIK